MSISILSTTHINVQELIKYKIIAEICDKKVFPVVAKSILDIFYDRTCFCVLRGGRMMMPTFSVEGLRSWSRILLYKILSVIMVVMYLLLFSNRMWKYAEKLTVE